MIHHEENIQKALFAWIRIQFPKSADHITHVPNGGHRHAATGARLKAAGVRRGVPDILCFERRGGMAGLAIELKAPGNGSRLSPQQSEWLDFLSSQGWMACVCVGLDAARDTITQYMTLPYTGADACEKS